ncbi:hypothetical protein ACHAQH_006672 [Verticillium albo-atrum]
MSESAPIEDRPVEQEEWTRVKSKSKFRRAPRNTVPKALAAKASHDEPRHHTSVLEIQAEFETFRTRWYESDAHRRLAVLLEENAAAHDPVRMAICLGVGTFDMEDGGWDARRRTYIQLIAFLDMVELLSKASSESIRCIFQEPRFTANDKAFLEGLGHEVVESPGAFEAVDEHSLLFAVHMYRPIYEAALSTLPAMFVGTGWETWDGVGNLEEGDFQCMQDMHASHKLLPFPQDGTYTTFSSTCVYWRPVGRLDAQLTEDSHAADVVPSKKPDAAGVTSDGEQKPAKDEASTSDVIEAGTSDINDDAKKSATTGALS